jgi:hypothetical protein
MVQGAAECSCEKGQKLCVGRGLPQDVDYRGKGPNTICCGLSIVLGIGS